MPSEPDTIVRLTRLAQELATDRAAMEARFAEATGLVQRWEAAGDIARAELVLVAVNLHGWYTALEVALERIARLLDQTVPAGPSWHLDLLAQMQVDVPSVRPAVLPAAVVADVHELRKFRHFFRNAYVLDLDHVRVRQRAGELVRAHGPVASALDGLISHLRAVLDALTSSGT